MLVTFVKVAKPNQPLVCTRFFKGVTCIFWTCKMYLSKLLQWIFSLCQSKPAKMWPRYWNVLKFLLLLWNLDLYWYYSCCSFYQLCNIWACFGCSFLCRNCVTKAPLHKGIQTQCHQELTSSTLHWLSTTKYQPLLCFTDPVHNFIIS